MRHILRSSDSAPSPAATKDARLPPSGRGSVHRLVADKVSAATPQSSRDATSPPPEKNEFSGLISRAKEGLSTSSSRTFHKTPEEQKTPTAAPRPPEKSETQIQWEEIEKNMARSLKVHRIVSKLLTLFACHSFTSYTLRRTI